MRHKTREMLGLVTHAIAERLAWALDRSRRDRSAGAGYARELAELIEACDETIPFEVREALAPLVVQLRHLDSDRSARSQHRKACAGGSTARRLMTIPSFRPITASAMAATIQDHPVRQPAPVRRLSRTDAEVVARCIKERDRGRRSFRGRRQHNRGGRASPAKRRQVEDLVPTSSRAVAEYLSVLDDAAFSGATPVEPKVISPTDPAARYTASANSVAGYAYSDNYLIDLKHAVIVDVEATTTIRQAEVGAAKTMLDRTAEQFDLTPSRLVADGGYGSADMVGWLVDERGIEPHVKLIDKAERTDGTFSRSDFVFDPESNLYVCPGGKELRKYHRTFAKPRDGLTKDGTMIYLRASMTARPAHSNPSAARTFLHAKSPAPFMKPLVTRPVRSQRRRPTPSHVAKEKRSRCSSLISSASSGWIDCACAGRAEPKTSSYWPPPPRT